MALPRWERAFFSSDSSWATVLLKNGIQKIGSYPKPLSPGDGRESGLQGSLRSRSGPGPERPGTSDRRIGLPLVRREAVQELKDLLDIMPVDGPSIRPTHPCKPGGSYARLASQGVDDQARIVTERPEPRGPGIGDGLLPGVLRKGQAVLLHLRAWGKSERPTQSTSASSIARSSAILPGLVVATRIVRRIPRFSCGLSSLP